MSKCRERLLEQKVVEITSYIPHSRVHALKTLPRSHVKRDDELGFGISGSKWRKYTSLIPYLKKYREAVVIGGAHSNHVLGISQLLIGFPCWNRDVEEVFRF